MTKYTGPIEEVEVVEKVKLTKEQAEAIEYAREEDTDDTILRFSGKTGGTWMNKAFPLNDMDLALLAKALYIGYEIEPEQPKFQTGDRIINDDIPGEILMVISPNGNHDDYRHATPEEIYWLEILNRDSVKDFRIGDIYIDREYRAEILENDRHVQLAQIWYADGDFKGLYPAESFRPFPKEQSNEQ